MLNPPLRSLDFEPNIKPAGVIFGGVTMFCAKGARTSQAGGWGQFQQGLYIVQQQGLVLSSDTNNELRVGGGLCENMRARMRML